MTKPDPIQVPIDLAYLVAQQSFTIAYKLGFHVLAGKIRKEMPIVLNIESSHNNTITIEIQIKFDGYWKIRYPRHHAEYYWTKYLDFDVFKSEVINYLNSTPNMYSAYVGIITENGLLKYYYNQRNFRNTNNQSFVYSSHQVQNSTKSIKTMLDYLLDWYIDWEPSKPILLDSKQILTARSATFPQIIFLQKGQNLQYFRAVFHQNRTYLVSDSFNVIKEVELLKAYEFKLYFDFQISPLTYKMDSLENIMRNITLEKDE
eukprot:NODE_1293_length_1411_cov_0.976372.p1 type:complete len:260 gc:universal NODE_1293_length_1411_cov_0.976372:1122-343(-)